MGRLRKTGSTRNWRKRNWTPKHYVRRDTVDYRTKPIDPQFNKIIVTDHAICRYQERVQYLPELHARTCIKRIVMEGRGSDREPRLKHELSEYLRLSKLSKEGRPVTLFYLDNVCCLVSRDSEQPEEGRLVVLTLFVTKPTE